MPRSASETFAEKVYQYQEKNGIPGVRVELAGPWAAYSFSGPDDPGPRLVTDAGHREVCLVDLLDRLPAAGSSSPVASPCASRTSTSSAST